MFHIGVATQHPPLPEPDQLSYLGIDFIRQCLTIDPMLRPTARELMEHSWLGELRYGLDDSDMATSPPIHVSGVNGFGNAPPIRQGAFIQETEVMNMPSPSPMTPTSELVPDFNDL